MEPMEVTLEQVNKLRELADVGYGDAKLALEASQGNLLDALIWLEQQGKITSSGVHSYSTREDQGGTAPETGWAREGQGGVQQEPFQTEARKVGQLVKRWLVDDRLEAYHRPSGREFQVPLGVALILLIMAFWLVPVLLVVGFLLGWRYRLAGPDLNREDVNQVMENLNDTADDVVTSVKKNFHKDG